MAHFDPRQELKEASRCRTRAEECHRLMLLAESGAEGTILTSSLWRRWKMIANQTDRYVAIMKNDAVKKKSASSFQAGARARKNGQRTALSPIEEIPSLAASRDAAGFLS
jgi:hypothetical protein